MTTTRMLRQGDLLLIERQQLLSGMKKSEDRILARGEVTGHSHQVTETIKVFRKKNPNEFLNEPEQIYIVGEGTLVHQEHGPIQIPKGIWEVRRQREYDPSRVRLISD